MANKIKSVNIKVHPKFFDGWFEPTRRSIERKTGRRVSQVEFTGMIADKFKFKPRRNTFVPKEFKNTRFYS